jgi:hypothetical protein
MPPNISVAKFGIDATFPFPPTTPRFEPAITDPYISSAKQLTPDLVAYRIYSTSSTSHPWEKKMRAGLSVSFSILYTFPKDES